MATTYSDTIETIAHGEIDDLATKELTDLVAEMQQLARINGGKQKGRVTVVLDLTLEKGVFDTTAAVTVKRPSKLKPRAWLFPTKDGGLSEEDTRQGKLDLEEPKDVSTPSTSNVRSIEDRRMAQAGDRS